MGALQNLNTPINSERIDPGIAVARAREEILGRTAKLFAVQIDAASSVLRLSSGPLSYRQV
jgi:hypothetical protein